MIYKNIYKGTFIKRPNRFIAHVEMEGQVHTVHVKNTGRCKELLLPGVTVYLEKSDNPNRKTAYSLISVQKGERLINMDSQAPNTVCMEGLQNGTINIPGFPHPLDEIKREQTFGESRLDFAIASGEKTGYIEVKGVTLEKDNMVLFPDAPTERGVKHIHELVNAVQKGFLASIIFIVQMSGVQYFKPNYQTHPAFGEALCFARENGVHIAAYDCIVTPKSLIVQQQIPIQLKP